MPDRQTLMDALEPVLDVVATIDPSDPGAAKSWRHTMSMGRVHSIS